VRRWGGQYGDQAAMDQGRRARTARRARVARSNRATAADWRAPATVRGGAGCEAAVDTWAPTTVKRRFNPFETKI
jgi:hypothetical protein